jgi:hypothetical protein
MDGRRGPGVASRGRGIIPDTPLGYYN